MIANELQTLKDEYSRATKILDTEYRLESTALCWEDNCYL
jgi:hypothetical protein